MQSNQCTGKDTDNHCENRQILRIVHLGIARFSVIHNDNNNVCGSPSADTHKYWINIENCRVLMSGVWTKEHKLHMFIQRAFTCSTTWAAHQPKTVTNQIPQTNNNKSTSINKYNSSDQQAAKYNRHNPALKGTSARVKVRMFLSFLSSDWWFWVRTQRKMNPLTSMTRSWVCIKHLHCLRNKVLKKDERTRLSCYKS